MLNRPRSSLPTTRRIRAARLSARSSGGMSRVPIAAWKVRLSRLRTRTVLRIELIRFVGSAVGGSGRGILPRGPRTTPSRFPITGISGASAMKKSYAAARARAFRLSLAYSSISCGWMTRSATARAFRASSPEANTQTRIGLPRPFGRTTSSSTRFFGTDRSTSRRFTATSTDSLNSRGFAASRSFLIVSTECLSAKGNRLLQFARPTEPPARGRRRKSVALIRLCGPRALHGSCGRSAADEAQQTRGDDLVAAAEVVGGLKESSPSKGRAPETDVWIYKGAESIGRKLREVILSSSGQILCVSPFPVAAEILHLLFDALGRSRRLVRVVLNESNRPDLAELSGPLGRTTRVQFHFPARPLSTTRLAHTYVFPSDQEVFILNSFYRDGEFAADKLQGLWVGDMDFVRIQLEAMLLDLARPARAERKGLPKAQ